MKKRIMIVDDNKAMVEMLKEFFSGNANIEVVDTAYDGEEAWEKIKTNHKNLDAVLLDLIMPRKDGISVLEDIRESKIDVNVIVVTSYNEQETIRNISEYGVKYFILKPFDLKELEKRILNITSEKNKTNKILNLANSNIQISVTKILHELGIPSHIKGYTYIRDAISMVYDNPSLIGGITKELYPSIGEKYETSVTRVERAIRHAIEVSWNRGDWNLMEEIFGHSVDIDKAKPTNSEFIVTIADKLRLEMLKVR